MVKFFKGVRFYLWKSSYLSLGLVRRRMLVLFFSLMVGGERELVFLMYDLILVKKKKMSCVDFENIGYFVYSGKGVLEGILKEVGENGIKGCIGKEFRCDYY